MVKTRMQSKRLEQETIEKIERCIFTIGKPCEVKIEHGKPTVVAIQRTVVQDRKTQGSTKKKKK